MTVINQSSEYLVTVCKSLWLKWQDGCHLTFSNVIFLDLYVEGRLASTLTSFTVWIQAWQRSHFWDWGNDFNRVASREAVIFLSYRFYRCLLLLQAPPPSPPTTKIVIVQFKLYRVRQEYFFKSLYTFMIENFKAIFLGNILIQKHLQRPQKFVGYSMAKPSL